MQIIKKMLYADASNLRVLLQLNMVDMLWFTGGVSRYWKIDDPVFRETPIKDPTISMLIRYMSDHPEENFVPRLPSVPSVFLKLCQADGGRNWDYGSFAVLMGCSQPAGYVWMDSNGKASRMVENLSGLLSNAIDYRGQEGISDFVSIVEHEARSRGIDQDALWSSVGWRENGENGTETDKAEHHRLTVKELCDFDSSDMSWISGTSAQRRPAGAPEGRRGRKAGPAAQAMPARGPERVTAALIWRYLMKFPEDSLLPAKPEPGEIEDALKSVMHKNLRGGAYVRRRLSQMLGCTGMSGYNWMDYRENISGIVSRLAMVMVNAIGKDGRAGFDRYLDTLEAEAKSRGFSGIQDVLKSDWRTKKADIAAQTGG